MIAHKSLWHGVDTAKVGYLVGWPNGFEKQLQAFQMAREFAQQGGAHFGTPSISLGVYPQRFMVRPMGARMLPYALESMGMVIFIGNTLEPWRCGKAITPNVRVEFQPWSVALEGFTRVHEEAMTILRGLGGTIEGNLLSEVHMTNDIETDRPHRASDYHASIDALWKKIRTRIRTNGQVHEVDTIDIRADSAGTKLKQINIGKDKKMLRVYDKILELQTHPDKKFECLLWKSREHTEYLCGQRRDIPPSTSVMRVEFQLRRERLIELQISTVEDFLAKQGGLWQHLTEEFVTMIEDDDTNRSRCSTQQWWQVVQRSWNDYPTCELPKRQKTMPDFKKYVDQAMGLMLSMGARIGTVEDLSLTDIADVMRTHWETTHTKEWAEIMRDKRQAFEILWASLPDQQEDVTGERPNAL